MLLLKKTLPLVKNDDSIFIIPGTCQLVVVFLFSKKYFRSVV